MLIIAAESAISALVGPIEKNESIIGNYYHYKQQQQQQDNIVLPS